MPDFTEQATALFARFASKHGLTYTVGNAPVELLWEFPIQPKLKHRIALALQNNDELNFGVGEFWSYFFPFEDKQAEFERVLESWIVGSARIVSKAGILIQTLELQMFEEGRWNTAYAARSLSIRKPRVFLTNN